MESVGTWLPYRILNTNPGRLVCLCTKPTRRVSGGVETGVVLRGACSGSAETWTKMSILHKGSKSQNLSIRRVNISLHNYDAVDLETIVMGGKTMKKLWVSWGSIIHKDVSCRPVNT